ncbi:MAG: hypothetical protein GY852_12055 [bacterium]|nr:hypothetical protein [bacterium]
MQERSQSVTAARFEVAHGLAGEALSEKRGKEGGNPKMSIWMRILLNTA